MSRKSLDELIDEAVAAQRAGRDEYLAHRLIEEPLSWDYAAIVRQHFDGATSLLDLDTGDGERLAALAPLPRITVGTEPWEPNAVRAGYRLREVGAWVVQTDQEADNQHGPVDGHDRRRLPLANDSFDLVICRHGSFAAREVARIVKPGGWLITQLVGSDNHRGLNDELGAAVTVWSDPNRAPPTLQEAGLEVVQRLEERPAATFKDIGAVVCYLLAVPWQIADFNLAEYRERLSQLHGQMLERGGLRTYAHRHLIVARKG